MIGLEPVQTVRPDLSDHPRRMDRLPSHRGAIVMSRAERRARRPGYTRPRSRVASRRPDRGGHAIARSGRVVRTVRRPTHRQANRRTIGGDPREICNQVLGQATGGLSILMRARLASVGAPTGDRSLLDGRNPGPLLLSGSPAAPTGDRGALVAVGRTAPVLLGAGAAQTAAAGAPKASLGARQPSRTKAPVEKARERTQTFVSAPRRTATHGRFEMAGA